MKRLIHRTPTLALLLALLALAACSEREDISVFTVPKPVTVAVKDPMAPAMPPDLPAGHPPITRNTPGTGNPNTAGPGTASDEAQHLLAAIIPRGEQIWHFKLMGPDALVKPQRDNFAKFIETLTFTQTPTKEGPGEVEPRWKLPEGWTATPGTGMRFATIIVGPASDKVALTVFRFGPESADVHANVERWASQVGVTGKSRDEILAMTKPVTVDGGKGTLIDITGAPPAAPAPSRAERVVAATPEGWTLNPSPGQFVTTQYDLTKDGKTATLTISSAGGDIEANLNRWRDQVGLPHWDEDGLRQAFEAKKEVLQSQIASRNAIVIDIQGPESLGDKRDRIIGALTAGPNNQIWFFKLRGPADLVATQKEAFNKFLQSVRFE